MNTRHSLVAACRRSVDMNSEQMLMQLDTVEFAIRNYPAVTLTSERIIFLVIKNPGKVLVYTFPHLLANIHWHVFIYDQNTEAIPPALLKSPCMNMDWIIVFFCLLLLLNPFDYKAQSVFFLYLAKRFASLFNKHSWLDLISARV